MFDQVDIRSDSQVCEIVERPSTITDFDLQRVQKSHRIELVYPQVFQSMSLASASLVTA